MNGLSADEYMTWKELNEELPWRKVRKLFLKKTEKLKKQGAGSRKGDTSDKYCINNGNAKKPKGGGGGGGSGGGGVANVNKKIKDGSSFSREEYSKLTKEQRQALYEARQKQGGNKNKSSGGLPAQYSTNNAELKFPEGTIFEPVPGDPNKFKVARVDAQVDQQAAPAPVPNVSCMNNCFHITELTDRYADMEGFANDLIKTGIPIGSS